jgi:tetratricopeptide (TPR) repeat protein
MNAINLVSRSILMILGILLGFPLGVAQHHQSRPDGKPVVLLSGLGQRKHPISTQNSETQKFFDQGLMMVFGFNRPEAVRSFRRATESDPQAAMPYWGLALALGRHMNMDGDMDVQAKAAHEAIQKAISLSAKASDYERAYILALAKRCSSDPKADGNKMDSDYRDAMRELAKKYPDDLDAVSLYAESVMNLHRYQWYSAEGKPAEETEEILSVLEAVLRRDPDHPLANHLHIHVLDTSPHPEYALASAYRLSTIAPGAGHLVHMPSHIFMTLGDYEETARINEQAAQADRDYMKRTGVSGNIYTQGVYYPHNLHMIVRARAEQGRFDEAKRTADELGGHLSTTPDEMLMMTDFYLPNSLFVRLRFQRWEDVLKMPTPDPKMFMTRALWHYGRTLALLGKGRQKEAAAEQAAFVQARSRVPADWMWMFSPAAKIMNLAATILEARSATDEKAAIEHWRRAVAEQDALAYDDPPPWYYPAREPLGAALLRAGQAAEAEAVFRENLKKHPRNGRSLFGLMESLKAQKKVTNAEWVQREFEGAWKQSQVRLRIEDF